MPEIIQGLGELKANFAKLAQGMETRISRAMVVAGGQLLKKEAKALALGYGYNKTGALVKNIAIKREPSAPAGTAQYHLGVRHGRNLTKKQKTTGKLKVRGGRIRVADDPFYWRFLEFGWIPRGRGQALKGGKRKKDAQRARDAGRKIAGRSFIGKALENKRNEAIDAMGARLQRELDKAAKK